MRYRGKDIELIGEKMVFGRRTAWIRLVEDNSFQQVLWDDIVFDEDHHQDISHIRFIALATRIKEEIAQKRLLAPYESSLIPLPHQILILEKLMKAPQTRFLLADEVGMGKTIEAGLALKELKLRGEIKRTLLIVPKSAMLQWQSELQQHFKEQFHIYDSQLINSMAAMKFYQGCLYLCKDTKFLANHNTRARIKEVRVEALREGFKQCFKDKDFATILLLGDKIPQNILTEDEVLLQYYDIAQMRS